MAQIKGKQIKDNTVDEDKLTTSVAGDGLEGGNGTPLAADLKSGGGLKIDTGEIAVEPADIAGNGLRDDGADQLEVDPTSSHTHTSGAWTFPVDQLQITGTPDSANDAVNKQYVDDTEGGSPTIDDKELNPAATTGDGQDTNLDITNTPLVDSYVRIEVNGVGAVLGDGVKTKDCFFSADAGSTARAISAIAAGDSLYWNGAIAGFDLETDDVIDMLYND
jgi:hypothetical protein